MKDFGDFQSAFTLEGRGFIDHIRILANPNRAGYEMIVVREYQRISEHIDALHRLPGWLAFAKARQGVE